MKEGGREDGEADLDVQLQVYSILSSSSQLFPVTCTQLLAANTDCLPPASMAQMAQVC